MKVPSMFKTFANKTYQLAKEPGKMLLVVGAMGWVLSSIAQVTAIVINNKIPEKQKKFLIPQEIADAAVNITSFIVFTRSFTKFGEKFAKSGKLATKELRDIYKKTVVISKDPLFNGKSVESLVGKTTTKINSKNKKIEESFDISGLPQITDMAAEGYNKSTDLREKYFEFADGVSFISSVVGSIISCNIVTPILRNKIASFCQKRAIAKDNIKDQQQDTSNPLAYPITPTQNKISINDYRSKVLTSNSGSMRI